MARLLLRVILGFILIVIVAVIVLVVFVKPEQFKPLIVKKVKESTGRDLVLDGELSWSFYPSLGITAGHMTLSNPAGFSQKTFLEVKKAELGVQLLPLLHGQIEAGRVILHGVHLNLIKNAKGQTNWGKTSGSVSASEKSESTETPSENTAFALIISDLDVSDANVHYEDMQTKQVYDLSHFALGAKNINFTRPFAVKTSFDVSAAQPAMKGHFTWTAEASLNTETNTYAFNQAVFSGDVTQQNKKIHFALRGNLITDLDNETFTWEKFSGQLANTRFTGGVKVTHLLSQPVANGHFNYEPFDLAAMLQSIGVKDSAIQAAQNVRGSVTFTASQTAVSADGRMQADMLQASNVKLQNISTRFHLANGILDVMPMTADLYQGSARAEGRVQFTQSAPKINFQLTLANIQAELLVKDLMNSSSDFSLSGVGNVSLVIATSGTEKSSLLHNLNGKADFSLVNGYITGMDLSYMLDTAYAFVNKQIQPPQNTGRTAFGQLTGSAVIQNGVMRNQDLVLDAPRFTVNGAGTIDLTAETINYGLQLTAKKRDPNQKDDVSNLYGIGVPVNVSGDLTHPRVGLDTARLGEAIAKRQLQNATERVETKIQKEVGAQLPGKAGDLLNHLLGQ